jgi:hypothetical protein
VTRSRVAGRLVSITREKAIAMVSRSPTTKKTARRLRLRVEPLEGRLVPAVFTVTTTADVVSPTDHRLSLREAVTAANTHLGADVIQLQAGVYRIALPEGAANDNAGGDFDVTGPLTIRGRGADLTAVDGGGRNRLFDLVGTFNADFRGLTLRNGGGAVNGAAIQGVDANLKLTGCVVSGNTALQGGGINAEHGNVTLTGSTVFDNVARGNGGGLSLGSGALVLVHSAVRHNLARSGGGICAAAGSVTLTASAVRDNAAFGLGACGGGIAAGGAVTLTRSAVSGNSAWGPHDDAAQPAGGGICAFGTATLTNSTVSGNVSQFDGGGIYAITATLTNSTVSGNVAGRLGGGLLAVTATLTDSTVSGNSAMADGGGVNAAAATLVNVTVTQNSAHCGGGLFRRPGGGVFSLTNTIVAGNLVDFAGTGRDLSGDFASRGHNLIGDPTGGTGLSAGVNGDLVGQFDRPLDPRLGPVTDNGGSTQTHALLAGSPAIDHGDNAVTKEITEVRLTADQRGRRRIKDGNGDGRVVIDIGAFER